MSTKPTVVPVWNSGGSNNVAPGAGKLVTGWTAAERPAAQYFNYLQKLYGEWLQYLSDGALTGAHSFSGLITATAGLTAAANQHVTASGTGRHKHGDQIKAISPLVNQNSNAWAATQTPAFAGYVESTIAGRIAFPIPMLVGERLKSVTAARRGNGAGTGDFTGIVIQRLATTGVSFNITAAATSDVDVPNAWGDKVIDATDTTCADGDTFWIEFINDAAGMLIGSIRVTYDYP